MKVSAILGLRSWKSSLHPPLPLTPRESQQLLQLLTSSFREQLNREHPSFRTEDDDEITQRPAARACGNPTRSKYTVAPSTAAGASSSWSTDHHLKSLLRSPLFSTGARDWQASVSAQTPIHRGSGEGQTASANPMAWFDGTVASGSATIEKATYALRTLKYNLTLSPETSIKATMAKSAAGSKVMDWLWSSGLQNSLDGLKHAQFIALLTRYLVAEMRQNVLRKWIYNLRDQDCKPYIEESTCYPSRATYLAQRLLFYLVRAENSYCGHGVKAAVDQFVRIAERTYTLETEGHDRSMTKVPRQVSMFLGPARKYLHQVITAASTTERLDTATFERFSQVENLRPSNDCYKARLQLYHPQKPSAEAALKYLKDLANRTDYEPTPKLRTAIVHLSLESASLLLRQDLYPDASWVMDFVRRYYAADLGITHVQDGKTTAQSSHRKPSRYNEVSNLELLAGLDIRSE
ncbi:Saccharopine dehydrogenase [Acarospora aff. strigata]|nr:Saccharopine dehydrogenase [Acarospora aff. strigata]